MDNVKQLKLTTGEEIICEILDWADEQEGDIVVRNVYMINSKDDDMRGYRYYNLKPWMTLQEGDETFVTLNIMHVVAQGKPDLKILGQYDQAVINSNLSEEELNKKVSDYITRMKDKLQKQADLEEEFENVVWFPGSDKLH
tara:strand:+ start:866 stop:1288 length:423 start_codon:yes stop_codon:yes gene_type:complete